MPNFDNVDNVHDTESIHKELQQVDMRNIENMALGHPLHLILLLPPLLQLHFHMISFDRYLNVDVSSSLKKFLCFCCCWLLQGVH